MVSTGVASVPVGGTAPSVTGLDSPARSFRRTKGPAPVAWRPGEELPDRRSELRSSRQPPPAGLSIHLPVVEKPAEQESEPCAVRRRCRQIPDEYPWEHLRSSPGLTMHAGRSSPSHLAVQSTAGRPYRAVDV